MVYSSTFFRPDIEEERLILDESVRMLIKGEEDKAPLNLREMALRNRLLIEGVFIDGDREKKSAPQKLEADRRRDFIFWHHHLTNIDGNVRNSDLTIIYDNFGMQGSETIFCDTSIIIEQIINFIEKSEQKIRDKLKDILSRFKKIRDSLRENPENNNERMNTLKNLKDLLDNCRYFLSQNLMDSIWESLFSNTINEINNIGEASGYLTSKWDSAGRIIISSNWSDLHARSIYGNQSSSSSGHLGVFML